MRLFRTTIAFSITAMLCNATFLCMNVTLATPAYAQTSVSELHDGINQFEIRRERAKALDMNERSSSDAALRYPLAYWRQWANQKMPPLRTYAFLLIVVSIAQVLFGAQVENARLIYDKQRLRMFGIGALVSTLGCMFAGFLYRLELFTPLAALLVGFIQLINLFGLAVAAQSTGIGVFRLLKLGQWRRDSRLGLLVRVWTGASILALAIFIPRLGQLPPLGNRLLCLIAVAGAGSLLASLRSQSSRQ